MKHLLVEEDDSHLGDFIEDQEATSPSDHAAYELLKEQLEDVLDTLTDREGKRTPITFRIG